MNAPELPLDKANHYLYGSLVYFVVQIVGLVFNGSPTSPLPDNFNYPVAGMVLVLFVGAAKELSDWILNRRAIASGLPTPHGVEFFDALATWCGGALPFLASLIATHGPK